MSYVKIVCRLVMIAMLVFVPAAIAGPALAAPATQGTMGKTKPPAPKPSAAQRTAAAMSGQEIFWPAFTGFLPGLT